MLVETAGTIFTVAILYLVGSDIVHIRRFVGGYGRVPQANAQNALLWTVGLAAIFFAGVDRSNAIWIVPAVPVFTYLTERFHLSVLLRVFAISFGWICSFGVAMPPRPT